MGSSEMDEDSLGQHSGHSSKLSLHEKKILQDPDPEPELELRISATPLSHSAARHKMAVRPRRTHGAPRRKQRLHQLPATPEVLEEGVGRASSPETKSQTTSQSQKTMPQQTAATAAAAAAESPLRASSALGHHPPLATSTPSPSSAVALGAAGGTRVVRSRSNAASRQREPAAVLTPPPPPTSAAVAAPGPEDDHPPKESFFSRILRSSGRRKKETPDATDSAPPPAVVPPKRMDERGRYAQDTATPAVPSASPAAAFGPRPHYRSTAAARQRVEPINLPPSPESARLTQPPPPRPAWPEPPVPAPRRILLAGNTAATEGERACLSLFTAPKVEIETGIARAPVKKSHSFRAELSAVPRGLSLGAAEERPSTERVAPAVIPATRHFAKNIHVSSTRLGEDGGRPRRLKHKSASLDSISSSGGGGSGGSADGGSPGPAVKSASIDSVDSVTTTGAVTVRVRTSSEHRPDADLPPLAPVTVRTSSGTLSLTVEDAPASVTVAVATTASVTVPVPAPVSTPEPAPVFVSEPPAPEAKEIKPETKPEPRQEPKLEQNPEQKPEPKQEPKPEPKQEPKQELVIESKRQATPEPEPQPERDPTPEPEPEAKVITPPPERERTPSPVLAARSAPVEVAAQEQPTETAAPAAASVLRAAPRREIRPAPAPASEPAVPEFFRVRLNRVDCRPAVNVVLSTSGAGGLPRGRLRSADEATAEAPAAEESRRATVCVPTSVARTAPPALPVAAQPPPAAELDIVSRKGDDEEVAPDAKTNKKEEEQVKIVKKEDAVPARRPEDAAVLVKVLRKGEEDRVATREVLSFRKPDDSFAKLLNSRRKDSEEITTEPAPLTPQKRVDDAPVFVKAARKKEDEPPKTEKEELVVISPRKTEEVFGKVLRRKEEEQPKDAPVVVVVAEATAAPSRKSDPEIIPTRAPLTIVTKKKEEEPVVPVPDRPKSSEDTTVIFSSRVLRRRDDDHQLSEPQTQTAIGRRLRLKSSDDELPASTPSKRPDATSDATPLRKKSGVGVADGDGPLAPRAKNEIQENGIALRKKSQPQPQADDIPAGGGTPDVVMRRKSAGREVGPKREEEPELLKVFARRSLKLKDPEAEMVALSAPMALAPAPAPAATAAAPRPPGRDSDKENEGGDSPREERRGGKSTAAPASPAASMIIAPPPVGGPRSVAAPLRSTGRGGGGGATEEPAVLAVCQKENTVAVDAKEDGPTPQFKRIQQRKEEWELRAQAARKALP